MPQNRIGQVNEVQKRVNASYPGGVDTESHRDIPILLARIKELENALFPFAVIGSTLASNEPVTRDVYTTDIAKAFDVMDPQNSIPPNKVEDFGIPATY